jgi:hypothetical protein
MKMGKQINLFLTEKDIRKIETYLRERKLFFLKDTILTEPKTLYIDHLVDSAEWANYILFPRPDLKFKTLSSEKGVRKYRLESLYANVIEFGYFGKVGDMYRIRFYFFTYFSDESNAHNPEFEALVNTFFRWLRKNYQRMPEFPTFYQNPAQPVSVPF